MYNILLELKNSSNLTCSGRKDFKSRSLILFWLFVYSPILPFNASSVIFSNLTKTSALESFSTIFCLFFLLKLWTVRNVWPPLRTWKLEISIFTFFPELISVDEILSATIVIPLLKKKNLLGSVSNVDSIFLLYFDCKINPLTLSKRTLISTLVSYRISSFSKLYLPRNSALSQVILISSVKGKRTMYDLLEAKLLSVKDITASLFNIKVASIFFGCKEVISTSSFNPIVSIATPYSSHICLILGSWTTKVLFSLLA